MRHKERIGGLAQIDDRRASLACTNQREHSYSGYSAHVNSESQIRMTRGALNETVPCRAHFHVASVRRGVAFSSRHRPGPRRRPTACQLLNERRCVGLTSRLPRRAPSRRPEAQGPRLPVCQCAEAPSEAPGVLADSLDVTPSVAASGTASAVRAAPQARHFDTLAT